MKLLEVAALKFMTDNPGGGWLKHAQERIKDAGKNKHGSPARFGEITGYFSRAVLLPVEIVANLSGVQGEHGFVRSHDFDWLKKEMETKNHLPDPDGKQYPPFVMVAYDGSPWVNEGNHRLKVAKALGWKYVPIELRYYAGGEETDGPLTPKKVKAFDSSASADGYKVGNDFRGKLDGR